MSASDQLNRDEKEAGCLIPQLISIISIRKKVLFRGPLSFYCSLLSSMLVTLNVPMGKKHLHVYTNFSARTLICAPALARLHVFLTQVTKSINTHDNSLFHPTPMSQGRERETGEVPAFCSGIGFNYLTFPSTALQAPRRWQVLINVTLGSVMISSHDTPYSPSLSLCLSSHIFSFISPQRLYLSI